MNRFCTCSCASENDYILALEVLLEATSGVDVIAPRCL